MEKQPNLWQQLAVETRMEIMKGTYDLPTLRNLLIAIPSDRDLYNRYHREIIQSVLANTPADIRGIVKRIWNGRYRAALALPDHELGCYYIWLVERWEVPAEPFLKQPLRNVDHTAILFSMAEMTESINSFATCFAKRRILIPSGHPEGQLSPTESHRVYRAFWLFQQLYESNRSNTAGEEKGSERYLSGQTCDDEPGDRWLRYHRKREDYWDRYFSMDFDYYHWRGRRSPSGWEVKEIEAIREHLRAEINSVQIDRHQRVAGPDPLENHPELIQEMINDIEYWSTNPKTFAYNHPLVADMDGYPHILSSHIPDADTPAEARVAHVSISESTFIQQRQHALRIHEQWGWCMFDRERLKECGLLTDSIPNRNKGRESQIRMVKLLKSVERQHKQCNQRLESCLDWRIQAQFDADVALRNQLLMRSEERKDKEHLIRWIKSRDGALFDQWTTLLDLGTFDRVERLQAKVYHKKALLMQSIEGGSEMASEEAELELLVQMRAYYNALRDFRNKSLLLSERGSDRKSFEICNVV